MLQVRRRDGFELMHQGENLLPDLVDGEFPLPDELVGGTAEVRDIRSNDTVVNLLTLVVDRFPLVPCFHLGSTIYRRNVVLDDWVSLDLRDSLLYVGYNVGLQDMSSVSGGRLTNVSFPSRYGGVGSGEGIQVVQVEVGSRNTLVDLIW